MTLQKVGNSHFYHINGESYPSVTTILALLNKGFMGDWVARITTQSVEDGLKRYKDVDMAGTVVVSSEYLATVLDTARSAYKNISGAALETGSDIHHDIEAYFECGLEPEKPGNLWLAFKDWLMSHDVVVKVAEHETYSITHKYAGTCDFVGMIDGVLTVCDWKTSGGIYPEYVKQVSAYRASEIEINGWDIKQGAILRLDKKSKKPKYEFKVFSSKELDHAFNSFKHLCQYWHAENGGIQ